MKKIIQPISIIIIAAIIVVFGTIVIANNLADKIASYSISSSEKESTEANSGHSSTASKESVSSKELSPSNPSMPASSEASTSSSETSSSIVSTIPDPTVPPIANPSTLTSTPIPRPISTPIPRPTSTPIPRPTSTPIPRPTSTPIPRPTSTPIPRPTSAPVPTSAIGLNNLIGQSVGQITAVFGQPNARELSEYGFTWFVYNSNYNRFIMIGIAGNTVVGVYSNSSALNFHSLTIGSARTTVRNSLASATFGAPLTSIKKGSSQYSISNTDQKDTFFNGTAYATIFYDNIEGGILTSIQLISASTEMLIGYYGAPSPSLEASFERTSLYLMNAIRSRKGIALLTWDGRMASIAKAHSVDMCVNNYFSHTNLLGLNSSARFQAAGIIYSECAENIAKNHASAITAHESFMNSATHRKNVLRLSKYVGVGVSMSNGAILLTQDFITYR